MAQDVKLLTSGDVDDMRTRALDEGGWSTSVIALIYTVQSREGTLRRLYHAVMATPLEGEELNAAMREVERALGIDP